MARHTDDAILLAEQIQGLDGLLGRTNNPSGRKMPHGCVLDKILDGCRIWHLQGPQ